MMGAVLAGAVLLVVAGCGQSSPPETALDAGEADGGCDELQCPPGTECRGAQCLVVDPCRDVVCTNLGDVCSAGECVSGSADNDGDGVLARDDCNDRDPAVYPDATEVCDGKDNECDDLVDEWLDADGDGALPPCGGAPRPDCDDGDPSVHPGADDFCDGKDDDCDGVDGNDHGRDGWACCDGHEVHLASDRANCGGCGQACPYEETCAGGACGCGGSECPDGLACCAGSCRDLIRDDAHCGACNIQCGFLQECSDGRCTCDPVALFACGWFDRECCDGLCADLEDDVLACGACGAACAPGQTCCGGACRDLATDVGSCGGCGWACVAGETCAGGACACGGGPACAAGETCCGDRCVATARDPGACGGCDRACAAGEVCCAGVCRRLEAFAPEACGSCVNVCDPLERCDGGACVCGASGDDCAGTLASTCCGDACLDLRTDEANCGECGATCARGRTCCEGACVTLGDDEQNCGACGTACRGTTCCSGDCTDLSSDEAHCGGCATPCALGQVCTAGVCGGG